MIGKADVVASVTTVLAEQEIGTEDEIVLDFRVTPEMAGSRIECRAFSDSKGDFTIASAMVFPMPEGTQPVAGGKSTAREAARPGAAARQGDDRYGRGARGGSATAM